MLFYCVNLDMSILMVSLIVFQFFHEVIRSVQLKTIYPSSISMPYFNDHAVSALIDMGHTGFLQFCERAIH